MTEGYWATHKYSRGSVLRDVNQFCGWDILNKIIGEIDNTNYGRQVTLLRKRDKALVATLFETGGRISEVLALEKRNFQILPERILVTAMIVVKNKVPTTRGTFSIKRFEPLSPIMVDWIKQCNSPLFNITPTRAYQIVSAIGDRLGIHLYDHWFRAQRASQLAGEYDFTLHDLLTWFSWKDYRTAVRYAKLGWRKLDKKMDKRFISHYVVTNKGFGSP